MLPEIGDEPASVAEELKAAYARGKSHAIAVIAEGAMHTADALMQYFAQHQARLGFELRMTKLGPRARASIVGVRR